MMTSSRKTTTALSRGNAVTVPLSEKTRTSRWGNEKTLRPSIITSNQSRTVMP